MEIATCRERLTQEIGHAPELFAYPNGQTADHNRGTAQMLREAGFVSALTTTSGFASRSSDLLALPRCGTPHSHFQAEATVSGVFETLKEWRREGALMLARAAS